jgi:uncharacterized protein (DUF736 family)
VKSKQIGVLWKKQDKNGNDYLSGIIDLSVFGEVKVAVFPTKDNGGNKPDYTIQLATPQKDNDFPKE